MANAPASNQQLPVAVGSHADSAPVVILLTNFLKQYHLLGEEGAVRQMLLAVSDQGNDPRDLGSFGKLQASDVRDAFAHIEVWKEEGRPTMPAFYDSKSHSVALPCVILGRNPDGTLELGQAPEEATETDNKLKILKQKADPSLVRPRPLNGWFVPMLPFMQDDSAVAEGPKKTASAGVTAVTSACTTADSSARVGSGSAPLAAAPTTPGSGAVWRVQHFFDGTELGKEYLVIYPGDELRYLNEGQGWAYGRILLRGKAALDAGIKQATISGGVEGWYPGQYTELIES